MRCYVIAGLFFLMCAFVVHPSHAQQSTGGPKMISNPAEGLAISPGNVDLRTGRYQYGETDLEIGSASPGAISLVRSMLPLIPGHVSPFGNMSHNWDISISEKRVNVDQNLYDNGAGNDFRMFVNVNGVPQTFQSKFAAVGFGLVSRAGNASLSFVGTKASSSVIYTYTDEFGTVINFRAMGSGDCAAVLRCAYASDMTRPDGTKFTFDYEYNAAASGNKARLRSIVSSTGYALLLEGSQNFVTKACTINLAGTTLPANAVCPTSANATTNYSYGSDRLTSVTHADGNVSSFGYTTVGSNLEMAFTKPGQSAPWLVNSMYLSLDDEGGTQAVVGEQRLATGETYTYTYYKSPDSTSKPSTIAGGKVVDNAGNATDVRFQFPILPGTGPGDPCTPAPCINKRENIVYQQTPGPTSIADPLNRVTVMDYCDPAAAAGLPSNYSNRCLVSLLQSVTSPVGNKTTYQTSLNRNIHQASQAPQAGFAEPNIVLNATYDCVGLPKSCAKPTSFTDANNNTTTYTYDAAHDGVLTETSPAVGGISPQKRYEYAQRYAWVKDSGSGYVQAATPVWLLVKEEYCKTTAASGGNCGGGTADEVVTEYDYGPNAGPNNLLLRGIAVTADGTTNRTCYGYDGNGRKISETKPAANLSACP